MEIRHEQTENGMVLHLAGRLDAAWSDQAEKAVQEAVREGNHRIFLEMSGVSYVSSAGIRVILASFKTLLGIGGRLQVLHPSEAVQSILRMAGLMKLMETEKPSPGPEEGLPPVDRAVERIEGDGFHLDITRLEESACFEVDLLGSPKEGVGAMVDPARPHAISCGVGRVALGLAALGSASSVDSPARFGEFLAAGGAAVVTPSDGTLTPDYLVETTGSALPATMAYGLFGQGAFSHLIRFERDGRGTVSLSALAEACFASVGRRAAIIVAVAEAAALVGATLLRPPVPGAGLDMAFPAVRDWLSFTAEPAFRGTSTLLAGVAAASGSPGWQAFLRPVSADGALHGHFHAAVFPYRPIRRGRVTLPEVVGDLFENQSVQGVLHLIRDDRPAAGSGESRFLRGVCWVAPVGRVREVAS